MSWGRLDRLAMAVILGIAGFVALSVSAPPVYADSGDITTFADPAGNVSIPHWMVAGPDGNLWFTNTGSNRIGRVTPQGTVTTFATPSGTVAPQGIAAGPDGNLWFADGLGTRIGRITTTGSITTFADPAGNVGNTNGIVAGPDGNLWFTSFSNNRIGRITPSGSITTFTDPAGNVAGPFDITAGPDGNLWFTSINNNRIGRITTAGVVTTFTDPAGNVSTPYGITSGPDGNLWFTNFMGGTRIGQITPSGVVTTFTDPAGNISGPAAIAAGPDGNLWFTSVNNNRIGQITTSGVVTTFTDPAGGLSAPFGIAAGPDGNVWFTSQNNNRLGYIVPPVDTTAPSEFVPLTPARILDTRTSTGGHVGPIGNHEVFAVQITGNGGVPSSGVTAVVMNVTAVGPTANGYLSIWPTGSGQPLVSNLNFAVGDTIPNLVTVAVGAGGTVRIFNSLGSTHVIFDVVGYYSPSAGSSGTRFHGVTPSRYFDTRDGSGGVPAAPIGPNGTLPFTVTGKGGVPVSGVTAVVMNVTAIGPTANGYVTVYPGDVSLPLASNLNMRANQTIPNLVTVRVPSDGVVKFFNGLQGKTHLIADVVGYYDGDKSTEAGQLIIDVPQRVVDTRVSSPFAAPGSIPSHAALSLINIPTDVGAVVMNVTAVGPTANGYLSVFPDSGSLPLVSNLNFEAGQTIPNMVIMKPGGGNNAIDFYNSAGQTHIIVDIYGFFTSSTFTATTSSGGVGATNAPASGAWQLRRAA